MKRLGFHLSIGNGLNGVLKTAQRIGCETIQIFGRNPRQWRSHRFSAEEIEAFAKERHCNGIRPLVVHLSYLPNLASSDTKLYRKSRQALQEEWTLAAKLDAEYLVLHPGHCKDGDIDGALERVARAIRTLFSKSENSISNRTMILLENMAGQGSEIGWHFGHLQRIRTMTGPCAPYVGYCIDTAHAFASGYAIDQREGWWRFIEDLRQLGRDHIKLIHLNDSKTPCGSRVDRHWHIGLGAIGPTGLRRVLQASEFATIPAIMETPKHNLDDDLANLYRARQLC